MAQNFCHTTANKLRQRTKIVRVSLCMWWPGICSAEIENPAAEDSETPSLHLKLKNLFKLHVWWTLSTWQAESWHRICPHIFCILKVSEWLTTLLKLKLGDSSFKSSDVSCGRVFNQVPCPRDVSHAHLQSLSSQSPAFPSHCSCVSSYSHLGTSNGFLRDPPSSRIYSSSGGMHVMDVSHTSLIWLWHDSSLMLKDKVSPPYLGTHTLQFGPSPSCQPHFQPVPASLPLLPTSSLEVPDGGYLVLFLLFAWQIPTHPSKLSWNVTYSVKVLPNNPNRTLLFSVLCQHTHFRILSLTSLYMLSPYNRRGQGLQPSNILTNSDHDKRVGARAAGHSLADPSVAALSRLRNAN